MIRINLSLDPSNWGSEATVEEAAQLAGLLQSVIQIECRENAVSVEVTFDLSGSNSCDEGEEDDLLWAEGMIAGPWMEKALSEYEFFPAFRRIDARVAAGENWFDAFNAEFRA